MLMINHVSQESATLITPRTALGIEILLLHFRHDVRSSKGALGITGVWDRVVELHVLERSNNLVMSVHWELGPCLSQLHRDDPGFG